VNILGMGPVEIVVVVVIALLVMGPDRLGSAVRTSARLIRDFRRTSDSFRRTFQELLEEPDNRPRSSGVGPSRGTGAEAQPSEPQPGGDPAPAPPDREAPHSGR
jgi:sec-independent protein translocase protein TatB